MNLNEKPVPAFPNRTCAKLAIVVFATCPNNTVFVHVIAGVLHHEHTPRNAPKHVRTGQQIEQLPPVCAFASCRFTRMTRNAYHRTVIALGKHVPDNVKGFQILSRLVVSGDSVPRIEEHSLRPKLLGIAFYLITKLVFPKTQAKRRRRTDAQMLSSFDSLISPSSRFKR